jgi:predicted membrane metal-binding protein
MDFAFAFCFVIWTCFALLLLRLWCFSDVPSLQPPDDLHKACVQWSSAFGLDPLFASLICGSSLNSSYRHLFLNLGIYHWFIASGSHLVLLMQFLKKMRITNLKILALLLFLYALTTSWQAPIVRALFLLLLSLFSEHNELQMTPQEKNLCSALLCLTLNPEWFLSLSLPLSWLCSLACERKAVPWKESLKISLFLLPLFYKWSALHVLYNTLLTPLFSLFLFPLSLVFFMTAPLARGISSWGNLMWEHVVSVLRILPGDTNPLLIGPSMETVWLYVFLLQFFLLTFEKSSDA